MNAVREGQLMVPTCPKCGCRLEKHRDNYYTHFGRMDYSDYDARGCRCSLIQSGFVLIQNKVSVWPLLTSINW